MDAMGGPESPLHIRTSQQRTIDPCYYPLTAVCESDQLSVYATQIGMCFVNTCMQTSKLKYEFHGSNI